MDSRRDFLKKAAMLSGAAGIGSILPPSIQRAFAIDPQKGSTYLDAEHIVILMQENRSFDHCFGALQGVRGFNDPRAITLPDKKPVWLQTNEKGETYAPFRLNIKDTKATWMGSLPHSWTNQVDARNGGKYDQWLIAKRSGHKDYGHMPLTLGYYDREDLPFYYSLADAFTVCDQNFCSSLTGTTPNRLYLWTGTIRDEQRADVQARVRNEELDYDVPAKWKTFPEQLEENNISWRIYQNEISVGVGFNGEEDAWLANFTDNPIEWFSQYRVKFHPAYRKHLPKKIEQLKNEIRTGEEKTATLPAGSDEATSLKRKLEQRKKELATCLEDIKVYTDENYQKLSAYEKGLHEKAFTTNVNDPDYHTLTTLKYREGEVERDVKVPKGDVLHQFREDVKNGKLPTVSWLVAPENFSDHPGAPWYGAWYLSEALDILTQNPEVWKKTIFILCYDENDGYFDHVPPFVPPVPGKPETGLTSASIDTGVEYVTLQQELKRKPLEDARESPIGLGYRVPLVIASPWSRGGSVCSQVFDHTSILQFLEKFLRHKTGKEIEETNISAWRRTVCGDLTSVFKPYNGEKIALPAPVSRDEFVASIHRAKFKKDPSDFRPFTAAEIAQINHESTPSPLLPQQEKGVRSSCALPYQLYASGKVSDDRKTFRITLESRKEVFGERTAGSPFLVYAWGKEWKTRSYAVAAGDTLTDTWPLSDFENGNYHFCVYGPNGFFREFQGNTSDTLDIVCEYERNAKKQLTGNIQLNITNKTGNPVTVEIKDNAYKGTTQTKQISAGNKTQIALDLNKSFGWYDTSIRIQGNSLFEARFAGRVETGKTGFSDPAMG
jgi:phospholipase C